MYVEGNEIYPVLGYARWNLIIALLAYNVSLLLLDL